MNKHYNFVKFFKKINLTINSLLEKYLNKLNFTDLANRKSVIASVNRVLLGIVLLTILFATYISIPQFFNKAEIREELKNQLFEKFSINFLFSKDFNYKFFPRPHFVIKESNIFKNEMNISEIKKLKIYVSLENLFSLKNIKVMDVVVEGANFNFNNKNHKFLINLLDNNFSKSNFKIKDSNIFFRNYENEVLFINKIISMSYYYDPNYLQNIVYSKNEIFNIPYTYELRHEKIEKKIFSTINLNLFKMQIKNEFNYAEDIKKGFANLIYTKNKSKMEYTFDKNFFNFNFFDKKINPDIIYKGEFNFNPFYSNISGNSKEINLSKIFYSNSFFLEILKTKIFNNKNLNIDLNLKSKKIKDSQGFVNVGINSKIQEGLIDIDNTKLSWNNFINFNVSESLLYLNKNELILDGKLTIDVIKPNEIYKFLLTPKNYRIKIKKIELNFNYNFDQKIMNFNNIKIDNQNNQNEILIVKELVFKNDKLQNKIYLKNTINELIKYYAG